MRAVFVVVATSVLMLSAAHAQQQGFATCSQAAEVTKQHCATSPHSARCMRNAERSRVRCLHDGVFYGAIKLRRE